MGQSTTPEPVPVKPAQAAVRGDANLTVVDPVVDKGREDFGEEITVRVHLPENRTKHTVFVCHCRERSYAQNILLACMRKMKVKPQYINHFAIWMESSDLSLQLQSHHRPAEVRKQWPKLVAKYRDIGEVAGDVVHVYIKRNAQMYPGDEALVDDPKAVMLLFNELLYNVMNNKIPVTHTDAPYLAALLHQMGCAVQGKQLKITPQILPHVLPPSVRDSLSDSDWITFIVSEHKRLAPESTVGLQKKYLQALRSQPFYGATRHRGVLLRKASHGVVESTNELAIDIWLRMDRMTITERGSLSAMQQFTPEEVSWEVSDDEDMFFLEWGPQDEPYAYEIASEEATLIDGRLVDMLDVLDMQEEAAEAGEAFDTRVCMNIQPTATLNLSVPNLEDISE
eukprot:Clim_evm3s253 gene=Clim_evmTU3s253